MYKCACLVNEKNNNILNVHSFHNEQEKVLRMLIL